MKNHLSQIKRSKLFENFLDEEILAVLSCVEAKLSVYKKNEPVFLSGDEAKFGLVLEGALNVTQVGADGNIDLIQKVEERDMFGITFLFSGMASNVDVRADGKTTLLILNHDQIVGVCSKACDWHSKLIRNTIKILSVKLVEMRKKLYVIHQNTIRRKLLAYFELCSAETHSNTFALPFTREEFANYLGVNRSALSRELKNMQNDGLIEYFTNTFVYKEVPAGNDHTARQIQLSIPPFI